MYDVIIVGGGPGGLYAALLLARDGFEVAVLEEHEAIGEPVHCTGVLATEAYEKFDLPRDAILNELTTARFYSPSGQSINYATDTVEALVVDRKLFDQLLCRQAEEAGIELLRGSKVTAVRVDEGGVFVEHAGHASLRARVCVLACGADYALQRRLGLGVPAVFLRSAQAELPAERLGDVELHFGLDVAPKGFAWAVPVQRGPEKRVRVGLMCERDVAKYFARLLERVGPRWGVEAGRWISPRRKILPLAPIGKTYADRLLVIGDAAGLVKPTTGGGIYYSIVSAAIAAEVLADALGQDKLGERTLCEYERRWRKRLGPELRAQLMLRLLAQRLTDPDIDGLFELAHTDGLMPLVRRTARFNHHRDLILALFKHPPVRKILFRRLIG